MKRALVVLFVVLFAGCMEGPAQPARVRYNEGVKALAENRYEEATKAFLDARSDAGFDGTLRYRAAFNLAEAYARQGEKAAADGPEHDAAAAIEHYRQAAAWFSDALRLEKDDPDARANLERVQARILALVDEANQGENGLEKRLDQLIAGERTLRDGVRGLWQAQDQRGAGADPLADKDAFDATSTQQRTLAAEAGVVADLAGDEITAIGGKPEAERKDEEKARLVQLQNLDLYIQDARKEMTDARRNLTELRGELAYRRVEGALEALKRAREQLLDPITVLRGVALDHLELLGHVADIEEARAEQKLGQAPLETPQWMQPVALGSRQLDIRARLEEVKARLAAAKDQEKVKEAIAAALPAIEQASAAMTRATESLRADDVKSAALAQREALEALGRAIEQFLDLRGLIDVALAEQGPVVAALTPPAEGEQAMPAANRARIVGDGASRNRDRVVRMQQMIAELAKPTAPPPSADGQPAQPEDPEAAKQREALYGRAEALRAEAQAALDQLVAVAKGGKGASALESATTAHKKLEEMQQLLFSVIEHLKKLVRDQGETRDNTNDAIVQDDIARKPLLPPITQRQNGHVQAADAIANALAQQADAAAQQQAQGQGQGAPQGGPSPQAFKEAAGEVRNALTSMQTAIETLAKASDPSATMSFDLSPVTASQQQAIEHLENALRLLQPPPKQDEEKQDEQKQDEQKQDEQKQDQEKQDQEKQDQQQQQQQQQQEQSKDEARRRLQQVRDREAQRQRERRERDRVAPDPVDKDW